MVYGAKVRHVDADGARGSSLVGPSLQAEVFGEDIAGKSLVCIQSGCSTLYGSAVCLMFCGLQLTAGKKHCAFPLLACGVRPDVSQ